MAMSELKQGLLKYELARAGLPNAEYIPAVKKQDGITEPDKIMTDRDNSRMPEINNAGDVKYGTEYDSLAVNTIRPLVDRVNESVAAWERSLPMLFDDLKQFRILAEYNGIMMAARDDTVYGRGLHFVTWQYNYERTGLDHGHYTEDYNAVKEDFAKRSGLVSNLKLFTPEHAAEIKASIQYRIENDGDITYATENELKSIAARLREAYPDKDMHDKNQKDIEPQVEMIPTVKSIFGDVQPGDWVIAAGNNDYGYLLGTVTAINKLGTPEHDTENETDDIHVDFTAFDYPPERIAEIEKDFSESYGEAKEYDELPLDDVIMAPGELIRITHLGHDEITFMGNLRQNCEAFCNCFISPSLHHGAKFDELVKRVDKNLADYHKILDGFGQGELIEMASRIDVMNEVHHYLTLCYDFSVDELDFYLQFENPLEIVADGLSERRDYSADLDYAMENLNERRDMILTDYPLINKTDTTVDNKLTEVEKPLGKIEKAAETKNPKKTLAEKMDAAKEKVKAQETQGSEKKTRKRDERD